MKTKDFVIRIRWDDFRRLKQLIRPYPKETMANYFERIVNRVDGLK